MTRRTILGALGTLLLIATAAALMYAMTEAANEHIIEQESQPQ